MNREDAIKEMRKYFDDNPEVGIFWYDEENGQLFEVHSIPAMSLRDNEYTFSKLHKTIWQKLRQKTLFAQKNNKPYNQIYLNDYTKIPRGRVFFKDNIFYVFVGSWITDDIKELIIDEFNLRNVEVIFKIDKHWEIGHGWSSEEDVLDFDVNEDN